MTRSLLVHLSPQTCARHLASTRLGRVAVSIRALPAIFPVRYALLGSDPVFRAAPATALAQAATGHVVCLQIDSGTEPDTGGWSVMVTGRADALSDDAERAAAAALALPEWGGTDDVFVRIEAAHITGREILGSRDVPSEA